MTFEEYLKKQAQELKDFLIMKDNDWEPIQKVFDDEWKALGHSTYELDAEYAAQKNWFEASYARGEILIHKMHKLGLEGRIRELYREREMDHESSLMRMPIDQIQENTKSASEKEEAIKKFRDKLNRLVIGREERPTGIEIE